MAFTPKDWRNATTHEGGGDETTPISAAALEDLETRVTDYADDRMPYLDVVEDYGADPTGVGDSTVVIQAAIDAGGITYFPTGTYKISAALELPIQAQLIGESRFGTVIQQITDNTPILSSDLADFYGARVQDLTLTYDTQQTAAQTNSFAIGLSSTSVGQASTYYCTFERLRITNARIGIGVMSEVGDYYIWACRFEQLYFSTCSVSCIDIGTVANQYNVVNTFNLIHHLNASTPAPSGTAVKLAGEWVINGLDIEDWTDQIFAANSGYSCVMNGTHIERHAISQGSACEIFAFSYGKYSINGFYYETSIDATNFAHTLLYTDGTADLIASNISAQGWGTVGTLALTEGSDTDSHVVMGLKDQDTGVSVGGTDRTIRVEGGTITIGTDAALVRTAANRLQTATGDNFWVSGNDFRIANGTDDEVFIGTEAISGGPGMQLGNASDVAFGRGAANLLALGTGDQFRVGGTTTAGAASNSLYVNSADGKLTYKDAGGTAHALY